MFHKINRRRNFWCLSWRWVDIRSCRKDEKNTHSFCAGQALYRTIVAACSLCCLWINTHLIKHKSSVQYNFGCCANGKQTCRQIHVNIQDKKCIRIVNYLATVTRIYESIQKNREIRHQSYKELKISLCGYKVCVPLFFSLGNTNCVCAACFAGKKTHMKFIGTILQSHRLWYAIWMQTDKLTTFDACVLFPPCWWNLMNDGKYTNAYHTCTKNTNSQNVPCINGEFHKAFAPFFVFICFP